MNRDDTAEKLIKKMETEVIPAMMERMNSIIASANLLKNTKRPNKRVASPTNQN